MTEFGSFDNSTCKRVLDLLEPGDLTLGQVVISIPAGFAASLYVKLLEMFVIRLSLKYALPV